MAILELSEIYNQKGEDFLKNLLNKNVTIYEKMASTDFSFEVKNKKIFFYKRNDSVISKIDRTLMKYYEPGINYIESISDIIFKNIKENIRIGFEYFPDKMPNYINYDTMPKNGLIISYVKENNTTITNKEILNKIAKLLKVSPPPILFQGKLDNEQQNKILEYLKLPYNIIKEKYKTTSFTAFLISLINPKLEKTTLNSSIDKIIPGIIFKFEDVPGIIYGKIIDPTFEEIVKKNKKDELNDFVPIVLIHMIEFLNINKKIIENFKFKEVEEEERYLELMCYMFNIFIKNNIHKFKDINISSSKLLKSSKFDINYYFIKNKQTLILLNNDSNKDLFKLFLGSFRKKRKFINNFLNNNKIIDYLNFIVDLIKNKISEVKESSLETFSEFLDYQTLNESIFNESSSKFELKNIVFWQSVFDFKKIELNNSKKKINLIIGKFQPFNKNHWINIEKVFNETKIPFIIIQVNNENNLIDEQLSKQIFTLLKENNPNIIKDYKITNTFDIFNLIIDIFKKYNVLNILSNENYLEFLDKLIKYAKKYKYIIYKIKLNKIQKLENVKITTEIINALKGDDLLSFRKYVPEIMYNLFDLMKEKVRNNAS